jgi:BirA family biotin operon repressor/biotin-[acetyl-CoA-carboxylase] ligase
LKPEEISMDAQTFKKQVVNGIEHYQFDELDSTQTTLRGMLKDDKLDSFKAIIVSTNKQTAGMGRQGNVWHSNEKSLTISFTFPLHSTPTLTPLQIGLLIADFFKEQKLKLKWPNDIMTDDGKKCGGILCHKDGEFLVVGVGLNLFASDEHKNIESKYQIGAIYSNEDKAQTLELDLYSYLLAHTDIHANQLRERWNNYCYHINQPVILQDGNEKVDGIFDGIGKLGEALITSDNKQKAYYTGSLIVF